MKNMILAFAFLAPLALMAKVGDFNSLITENTKAQSELHHNLKQDLDTTRMAYKQDSPEKYIVDNESKAINVPTSKSLLTFKKEKKYYRASEEQKQKRLAEEQRIRSSKFGESIKTLCKIDGTTHS